MDYHLKAIGKVCAATGEEFTPGDSCYSALIEQGEQIVRLDFLESAWNGPPENCIGFWKSVVPEQNQKPNAVLDPDALLRYFEQLCEDASPVNEKFCYVLSLLLLQKRKLRIDGNRKEDDIEFLQLSGTRGEGPFDIRVLDISDDEIQQLQQNLNGHLQTEWS